jgi:hypothetical protein
MMIQTPAEDGGFPGIAKKEREAAIQSGLSSDAQENRAEDELALGLSFVT